MPRKTSAKKGSASNDNPDSERMRNASLELAHLTAELKMAGIIPYPVVDGDVSSDCEIRNSPRRLILAATEFLATCAEVQTVLEQAQDLESKQALLRKKIQNLSRTPSGTHIPISEVIKLAGAEKLKLTADELASLRISTNWEDLSPAKQARAVFLCLSSPEFEFATILPNAGTGAFIPTHNFFANIVPGNVLKNFRKAFNKRNAKRQQTDLETTESWNKLTARLKNRARRILAHSGIDVGTLHQWGLIIALQQAKTLRESKNAAIRAYKSHEARSANGQDEALQVESGSVKSRGKSNRQDGQFAKKVKDSQGRFKKAKPESRFAEAPSTPLITTQRKRTEGGG
jgi:hypothetical protein